MRVEAKKGTFDARKRQKEKAEGDTVVDDRFLERSRMSERER